MARPPLERSVAGRTVTLHCTSLFIDGSKELGAAGLAEVLSRPLLAGTAR